MTEFAALRLHLVTDGVEEGAANLRDVGAAAGEAEESVSMLDNVVGHLAERFIEWRALEEIVDGLKEFAKAGLEAARATQLLDNQLQITAPNMTYLTGEANDAVEAVSAMGASTETELTVALQRLILVSGNAAWSIAHLKEVQEIASATGMDLTTAALDLGRAYNGVWIQLERLGLVTKEQVESGTGMAALEQKTRGATEAATTGAGEWTKFFTILKNAAETDGAVVMTFLGNVLAYDQKITHAMDDMIGVGHRMKAGAVLPSDAAITGGQFPGLTTGTTMGAETLGSPAWWAAQQSAAFQIGTTFTPEQIKATAELQAKAAAAAARAAAKDAAEHPYLGAGYGTPNAAQMGLTGGGMSNQGTEQGFGALESAALGRGLTGLGANLSGTGAGTGTQLGLDEFATKSTATMTKWQQTMVSIADSVNQAWQKMAHGVMQALTEAFEGGKVSGILAGLGKTILKGFGQMFEEQGQALLAYSAIMKPIAALLSNPFTAGPAAAAAGVALIALGAAFNAIGSSGAAVGSGSAGGSSVGAVSPHGVSSTSYLLPSPGSPFAAGEHSPGLVQPVFNVIGTGDPRAQSDIMTLLNNAVGRGYRAPGIAGT